LLGSIIRAFCSSYSGVRAYSVLRTVLVRRCCLRARPMFGPVAKRATEHLQYQSNNSKVWREQWLLRCRRLQTTLGWGRVREYRTAQCQAGQQPSHASCLWSYWVISGDSAGPPTGLRVGIPLSRLVLPRGAGHDILVRSYLAQNTVGLIKDSTEYKRIRSTGRYNIVCMYMYMLQLMRLYRDCAIAT
jgi:hypothetical protein